MYCLFYNTYTSIKILTRSIVLNRPSAIAALFYSRTGEHSRQVGLKKAKLSKRRISEVK